MKRILSAIISLMLIISALPSAAYAAANEKQVGGNAPLDSISKAQNKVPRDIETPEEETPEPVETNVTGLVLTWSKKAGDKIKDTINISPAYSRKVELQMYNSVSKKWETAKTFTASENSNGKLVIEYPSNWTKTQKSKWRIYMPATPEGLKYKSKTVIITTKNRKELKLSAKSAVIMKASNGDILYDKSMNSKRHNASTTKIMTAIIALENSKLKKKMKITKRTVRTPYRAIRYKKGDKVYMRNILNCMLIGSDNGSATAIAENISGSNSKFAKKMNKKAKDLGCENTNFANPHGLPNKKHYTTAYDMSLITKHAVKKSTFRKIVKKKSYSFKTLKKKKKYKIHTTNRLLGKVKGVTGAKTGTTNAAGCCFVGTFQYKGETYITVVFGSNGNKNRWSDTKKLLNYIKKYE